MAFSSRWALLLAATTFVVLMVVLTTRAARADMALQFWADGSASFYRGKTSVGAGEPYETKLRSYENLRVGEVRLPPTLGANLGLDLVFDDRYVVPMFGLGAGGPVGTSAPVRASVDGTMVEVRPWRSLFAQLHLPGFGIRLKERRWLFAATFRTALVGQFMEASISTGRDAESFLLTAATFSMRAEFQACRRLDPVNRVCFVVAPKLYEYNWLGGISLGLRWEYGP